MNLQCNPLILHKRVLYNRASVIINICSLMIERSCPNWKSNSASYMYIVYVFIYFVHILYVYIYIYLHHIHQFVRCHKFNLRPICSDWDICHQPCERLTPIGIVGTHVSAPDYYPLCWETLVSQAAVFNVWRLFFHHKGFLHRWKTRSLKFYRKMSCKIKKMSWKNKKSLVFLPSWPIRQRLQKQRCAFEEIKKITEIYFQIERNIIVVTIFL